MKIHIVGISEDIALWRVYNFKDESMFFYTDIEGNILFHYFFDFATLFCDGCAPVIANGKAVIIDVNRHRLLSCPIRFKSVRSIQNNQLSVLDYDTNKWGSYNINPETGIWTQDIPFIWDGLSLLKDADNSVLVGLNEGYHYSDVDRKNSNSIVYESFYRALDYYELNYFRNKGEVVEAGNFKDYSLTLSKVISK